MRLHPLVRKAGILSLLVAGALILGSVLTATLFERQIGRKIIAALNEELSTELTVDRFELSFLTRFPNLSASLRGVSLMDTEGGLLMQADRMAFSIGLLSFITSEYKLHSVQVSDGVLHLRWDGSGKPNYAVFSQSAPDTTSAENLSFSLREAEMSRIELDMEEASKNRKAKGRIEKARFSGKLNTGLFRLKSDAEGLIGFFEEGDQRFLVNQPFSYSGDVDMDREQGGFELNALQLVLGSSAISLQGARSKVADQYDYDLKLHGQGVEMEDLIEWLPPSMSQALQAYHARGKLLLSGNIRGRAAAGVMPPLQLRMTLDRGRIGGPALADDLKDLSFVAKVSAGPERPPRIVLDSIAGYFGRELLEGSFEMEASPSPAFSFHLNGAVPLSSLYPMLASWMAHPEVEQGLGDIELDNLHGEGSFVPENGNYRLRDLSLEGKIVFDDAGLTIRGEDLRFDRGTLLFSENQLRIEGLKLEGAGNEMELDGRVYHALSMLQAGEPAEEVEFTGDLRAARVDLGRLLKLAPLASGQDASPQEADSLARERIRGRMRITRKLRGLLKADINSFRYGDVEVLNFMGDLNLDNNELAAQGDLESMGGTCQLSGSLLFSEKPGLEARIQARDIQIDQAFRQTQDFGQEVIGSRNLKGRLHTQMIISAQWDEAGHFQQQDLRVQAGVAIENGELNGLGMLEQFADYVDIRDLRQIRFADLEHYIEIRDRDVYIPVLFLQSNALNLTLSGQHRFDGNYTYQIKLNAGQVLTNRFRKHDPSLQPRSARRKGFFNLYYSLKGDEVGLRVEKSRREVRDDFERGAQRVEILRAALKNAFGDTALILEPEEWQDEMLSGDGGG